MKKSSKTKVQTRRSPRKSKVTIKSILPLFVLGFVVMIITVFVAMQEQNLFSKAALTTYTAGVTSVGSRMDSGNSNGLSATQVTTGANPGTLTSISVYVGKVQANPRNHMQVALYADNGTNAPSTFLTSSASQVLQAKTWNTFTLNSIAITPNTKYWLAFNVDGSTTQYAIAKNTAARSAWKIPTAYGSWPNPMGALTEPIAAEQYSVYMSYSANPTPTVVPTAAPSSVPTVASMTATPTPLPSGTTTADFPRLGGMLIGSPHNFDESAYQQQIAKLDIAVLGMYPGWNRNGKTMAQAVSEIKAKNPNIKLANYTIMTEVNNTADPATAPWRTKLSSEKGPNGIGDWWAYDNTGKHTDWSGGSYGSWDANLTLLTTPDAAGNHWTQWKAKYDYQTLLQGTGFDIWYSDNNMWKPRSNPDWNRDGSNDSYDSLTARNWWRDGQRAYYDTAKSIAPTMPVMVNADSDLDGSVFPSGADHFTQYKNAVGEAFIEHAMGESWSAETWGGWNAVMGWYRQLKANLASPQIVMFDVSVPNTSDYQYLRYAFATCLMDDGYFSASTDYNQVLWFDEFDLAGTATTKWLGKALDGPRTIAWQNGVYRRNFEHGTVLVNPKGNGSKTVTIEAGYHKFLGRQAPTINNGQAVTTVTLNDRDGLFLVKN